MSGTNGQIYTSPAPVAAPERRVVERITELGCADGVASTRVTTSIYNSADGALVAVPTVQYINSAGVPVVPALGTWTLGDCPADVAPSTFDFELTTEEGCANGVTWFRIGRTRMINPAGFFESPAFVYRNAAGAEQSTAPAGWALGSCATIDTETTTEEGCAAGLHWTRVVTKQYSRITGAQLITSTLYRNSAGAEQAASPAGWTLGACPCDDELGDGCYTSGATVRKWKSFRRADGTVSILDTITGATVAPASIVNCTDAAFDKTLLTTVNATEVYSISSTGLKSWTVRCIIAGVTLSVDGENTVMVAGEIISATASDDVTLLDPVTVTAGAGSARVIYTYRAP